MKIFLISILVVFLDQISKILVKNHWQNNDFLIGKIKIVGDYLRIIFIENPGIAFGLDTSSYHLYVTLLTVVAVIFLIVYLYSLVKKDSYEKLSMSLILGGAIGNLVDRILVLFPNSNYNGVIDFIDVGVGYYRWYTFNVADASITLGLIIFIYQTYILKKS